jgi:ankyrin repeat domain-containing protein 50
VLIIPRSIVIHYLEQLEAGSRGTICVAYVYLRYSEPLSLRDILESLVKQILERHEDLLSYAEEVYAKHKREKTRISQDELVGLLERFASVKTVFFVLDALDELREQDRPVLLGILASLNTKLFITSRPLVALQQQFPHAQIFDIVADPSDIKLLVRESLGRSPDLMVLLEGSGLEDEITSTICQQAGGM